MVISFKQAFSSHSSSPLSILVIPPNSGPDSIKLSKEQFDTLAPYVDFFSLMTYDYSKGSEKGYFSFDLQFIHLILSEIKTRTNLPPPLGRAGCEVSGSR